MKKRILEDMLRVVHFGSQAVSLGFSANQNIMWFTDSDPIVANERHEQLFGKFAEALVRSTFLKDENVGNIGFGLTSADDGSLELEDFASVPDLVAGALCEMLGRLAESGLRITPKIILNHPKVSKKTDLICQWIGKYQCPLKKLGIVFDKTEHGNFDWQPTFFHIKILNQPSQTCCGGQRAAQFMKDPIRFDIFEDGKWKNQ